MAAQNHPTLLRMPPWLGYPEERWLPLPPEAYTVREVQPDWWIVTEAGSSKPLYSGLGPVEVAQSPAPF